VTRVGSGRNPASKLLELLVCNVEVSERFFNPSGLEANGDPGESRRRVDVA
jgi:hypothetical protein